VPEKSRPSTYGNLERWHMSPLTHLTSAAVDTRGMNINDNLAFFNHRVRQVAIAQDARPPWRSMIMAFMSVFPLAGAGCFRCDTILLGPLLIGVLLVEPLSPQIMIILGARSCAS